jgi:hypothetical protein
MTWADPTPTLLHPPGPIDGRYRVTSWFGWRTRNGAREYHPALDIGNGRLGGDVLATAGGTVLAVGNLLAPWSDPGPFPSGNYGGLMVILDHPGGTRSLYAHLGDAFVVAGQQVAAGDRLGIIGESGSAQGQGHLHFSIGDATGWIDPWPLLTAPSVQTRRERLAAEVLGLRQLAPDAAARWHAATGLVPNYRGPLTREMRLAAQVLQARQVAAGAMADWEAWTRFTGAYDGQPVEDEDRLAAEALYLRQIVDR